MRLINKILLTLGLLISNLSFGQGLEGRYEFFNKYVVTNLMNEVIITKNGSSEIYELFIDKENGFNPRGCMFINNKYYSEAVWDSILVEEDIEFFYNQIDEYKNFKWSAEKLPDNVVLYSKWRAKRYSRKALRYFNRETNKKDLKILSIYHYSLPIFNLNENFAIVYCGSYIGPLSASTSADIYLKIDGKWEKIGTYLHSMS